MSARGEPRYAEGTTVAPEKSRIEIEALLTKFKATAYSWTITPTTATIRFQWSHGGVAYTARLAVAAPTFDDTFRRLAKVRRHVTNDVVHKEIAAEYRRIHRLLLLKLKGDLVAVTEGLCSAVEVLLPYLETPDGLTVAEALIPRLPELTTRGPARLLEDRSHGVHP